MVLTENQKADLRNMLPEQREALRERHRKVLARAAEEKTEEMAGLAVALSVAPGVDIAALAGSDPADLALLEDQVNKLKLRLRKKELKAKARELLLPEEGRRVPQKGDVQVLLKKLRALIAEFEGGQ